MVPFWNEMAANGWVEAVPTDGPVPGLLNEAERMAVEAEIEVLVARDLYGLSSAEMAHILHAFPIVERRQREAFGEYRTKRLVLDLFDTLPVVKHSP